MINGYLDKLNILNQCQPGRKYSGTCQGVLIHSSLRMLLMAADMEDTSIKCARTEVSSAWRREDLWRRGRPHRTCPLQC